MVEGWSIDRGTLLSEQAGKYSITCLRHPIERIKSSYRYEGRGDQDDEVRSRDSATSFRQWIDGVLATEPSPWLWNCVDNYYVKALIGYPKKGHPHLDAQELQLAKEALSMFEMVLITERLSTTDTALLLESRMGISKPVPHRTFPTAAPSPDESDQDLFDAPTLARLADLNALDVELYQYATELYANSTTNRDWPRSKT